MESGTLDIKVKNLDEVMKGLDKNKEYVAKAVNATCRDFKSRGKAWVSKSVTQEYAVKASEVKEAFSGVHNIGHLKLGGVGLDNIKLEYSGRPLTFAHFKYTPKKPAPLSNKKGVIPGQFTSSKRPMVYAFQTKKKPIKVEILKGQKHILKGDYSTTPFIASMNGSPMMPFQRRSNDPKKRTDVEAPQSTSVPQMITNEKVSKDISERIDTELSKRLEHHLERYSSK